MGNVKKSSVGVEDQPRFCPMVEGAKWPPPTAAIPMLSLPVCTPFTTCFRTSLCIISKTGE